MGTSQRRKGVSGELEVAHLFQDLGFNARRGVGQFQSASLVPDVVLDDLPMYWIEVKRGAQTSPFAALEQATTASKGKKIAIAICRNDGGKHNVTMYLSDWMNIRFKQSPLDPLVDGTTKVSIPIDIFLNYFKAKHEDKCKQLTFKQVRSTSPVVDPVKRTIDSGKDSSDVQVHSSVQRELDLQTKRNEPT
jgi:hypothetical protein